MNIHVVFKKFKKMTQYYASLKDIFSLHLAKTLELDKSKKSYPKTFIDTL